MSEEEIKEIQKLVERTEKTLNGESTCWQDNRLYEFIEVIKQLIK